jgi:hypothetical protein
MSTDAAAAALASAEAAVPEIDEKTKLLIAVALFVYNSFLNEEYSLDELTDYENDALRTLLCTDTPGLPSTFPRFFDEIKTHWHTIIAKMMEADSKGWPCKFEKKSKVAETFGIKVAQESAAQESAAAAQEVASKKRAREDTQDTQREE